MIWPPLRSRGDLDLVTFHLAMFHRELLNGSEVAPFGYSCRNSQELARTGASRILTSYNMGIRSSK